MLKVLQYPKYFTFKSKMADKLKGLRQKAFNTKAFIRGKFCEAKVAITGKPIVFAAQKGFLYWQDSSDPILKNHLRCAVGDSIAVVNYIFRYLNRGSICIDIGACIGSVSVPLWSATGKSGKVISVEADPQNISKLKANLMLNGFSDKFTVNAAIGEQNGQAELRRYDGKNGWQTIGNPSFAKTYPFKKFIVPECTLDTILTQYNIDFIDFIKVDTEGAEPMVLNGMRRLLEQKLIKQVIFEVNHLMLEGTGHTVDQLFNFWSSLEYNLYLVTVSGEREELPSGKWPNGCIGDCVAIVKA